MTKRMLLLTVIMALLAFNTIGQERLNNRKISVDIIAGGNYQTILAKDYYGNEGKGDFIAGFHGGVDVEFRILSHFSLRPGILYTTKGYASRMDVYGIVRKYTYRLSYIEVPVNLLFKQPLGKSSLLLGMGPYFAVALNGKEKSDFGKKSQQFRNSLNSDTYYGVYEYLRGTDAGVNLLVGYQLSNGLSVQLNAQYGVAEMMPSGGDHSDLRKDSKKNRGFGISIGYRL